MCNHEYCSSQRQKKFGWLLLELLLDPLPILSCVKLVRKNKLLPVIHSIKILVALAKVGLSILSWLRVLGLNLEGEHLLISSRYCVLAHFTNKLYTRTVFVFTVRRNWKSNFFV